MQQIIPKRYKAKIVKKKQVSTRDIQIDVELLEPNAIDFIPGQFISLKVSDTAYRAYSICSDSRNKKTISILVTILENGIGSSFVNNLTLNEVVSFIGPSGRFKLSESPTSQILFVCTGSGVAPFISMLYKLQHLNFKPNIVLYFGLRKQEEVFFIDKLEGFKSSMDSFNYVVCLSQENNEKYSSGRVTEKFKIESVNNTQVYLCGNPHMIEEMLNKLQALGVPNENVFHEKFILKR